MKEQFSAGALFSGIGGFCLGFESVGIKTKWAVELDSKAVATYEKNIKDVRVLNEDIREITVEKHGLEPVDVLHAGFPCQSFSQAGERKGFDDPRGKLFFEIIRLIKEFGDDKPSVLIFENSPYIRNGNGGAWFLEIERQIKQAGYWFKEMNAQELDSYKLTHLPQKRNRLFMVAFAIRKFRTGRFQFPFAEISPSKKLSQFVEFEKEQDAKYYLSDENRYFEMIKDSVDDRECIYQLRKYLVRVKEKNTCPTLTANMGQGGHNVPFIVHGERIRKLTEYECAALQGFPDWFKFPDNVSAASRYTQIGNAVAVPVIELLAKQVHEKLSTERLDR